MSKIIHHKVGLNYKRLSSDNGNSHMGTNDFLLGYWEPEKISIDNGNQLLNIDQCAVQFEKNLVIWSS